jgi:hypothetical protein
MVLAVLRAAVVSLVALGAVLSVTTFQDGEGWFPLSRYPMFSVNRPPREPLPFVEVEYADGTRARVAASVWSTGVVGVARNTLAVLPRRTQAERDALCADLAGRMRVDATHGAPARVAVMAGQFRSRDVIEGLVVQPRDAHPMVTCAVGQ